MKLAWLNNLCIDTLDLLIMVRSWRWKVIIIIDKVNFQLLSVLICLSYIIEMLEFYNRGLNLFSVLLFRSYVYHLLFLSLQNNILDSIHGFILILEVWKTSIFWWQSLFICQNSHLFGLFRLCKKLIKGTHGRNYSFSGLTLIFLGIIKSIIMSIKNIVE